MALAGRATAAGTARYASRLRDAPSRSATGGPVVHPSHFRETLGLTLSSVGVGTSLGDTTDAVDDCYRLALAEAVRKGCNVLDTAASYRAQRSEIALGRAVADLVNSAECQRDELVIVDKAGFIAYRLDRPGDPAQYMYDNFIRTGIADPDDLAGGIHCMAPNFLGQQIVWSLRNTDLRTLDVFLIQNPETQLSFVDRATFRKRLQLAFARLEEEVAAGRLGCYGVATWEGLRRPPVSPGYMSLEVMLRLAAEVAGPEHSLRVIQLPINAGMVEAVTLRNQPVKNSILPVLHAARDLGLTVLASAALGKAQTPARAEAALAEAFPELQTPEQRSLQFVRSLPGVTTALFGSARAEHVRADLGVIASAAASERALRLAHNLAR